MPPVDLESDRSLLGFKSTETADAFPLAVLNFRELVNDELGGVPVLVSYCPLCGSAVVYRRELEGRVLTFGNTSALVGTKLDALPARRAFWFSAAFADPGLELYDP